MINFLNLLTVINAAIIPRSITFTPLEDSFYSAPSNLDSMENGSVYNSRSVPTNLEIAITFAGVNQVAYKTIDTQGNSSHSVVTVFSPSDPDPDTKILSYQVYEDSANLNCAPSYSLIKGINAPDSISITTDAVIAIDLALSKGWYVVVPDHEGARSAFMANHEQAYAGLDGIKASISYLGLGTDTPVALLGYSGGGSVTAWMASLHASHASELNVVGAAHGGTPVDLESSLVYIDKADSLFSGFAVAGLGGLLNAYPDLYAGIWSHFYSTLQNAITSAWSKSFCMTDVVLKFMHQEWHTMADIDILTYPPFAEISAYETLLKSVNSSPVPVPLFPRYIWHADTDELVPSGPVKQYVSEQCTEGANIQYVPWKGDDHIGVLYLGFPDALQFIIQSLENRTPKLTCGTANDDVLTLVSTSLGDVLGQVVADIIQGVSVITTPLGNIILNATDGYQS